VIVRDLQHLTKRDLALALGGGAALAILGAAASSVAPAWTAGATGILAGALFAGVVVLFARHRGEVEARFTELDGAISQIEPLIALSAHLGARRPLPPMTVYSIAPDFALLLFEMVCDRRPQVIVETGSGVSTLVCAYALEKVGGDGHILALDHDATYADKTRATLAAHGLAHRATVVHAPLEPTAVGGGSYLWYRQEALASVKDIDLVIDDGPPKYVGKMARYASLHVLSPKMRPAALFVLDVVGKEERTTIHRWLAELPFEASFLATRKGNVIFRRRPP
jgi:predicted O-methyltransferase YrrM